MQDMQVRTIIEALGTDIGPASLQAVTDLYDGEQRALLAAYPATAKDVSYGPDERHHLDVYQPSNVNVPVPVVIWVHGGGFMRGDKGDNGQWQNANAGSWAAREGYLGLVMNYRLAPLHRWPSGAQDIAAAIAWAKREAVKYGGDPAKIFLIGTSAGAAHVAGYIKQYPDARDIRAAVFLSGLYGVTPPSDVRDLSYFGEDTDAHDAMLPLEAVTATEIPLLVVCSEFDPPRFQQEFAGLLQAWLDRRGRLPRAYIASGHNHYSLAYHLGTRDSRLSEEIGALISSL